MVRRVEAVRMARWMRSKADQEATNAFRDTSTPPILVYQMGKVGSSTVFASLKEAGVRNSIVKILEASLEAFEFPDLKIEGTKQASGN